MLTHTDTHTPDHATTLTNVSIFKNSEEIRIEITLLGSVTDKHHMNRPRDADSKHTFTTTGAHTSTNQQQNVEINAVAQLK